MCAFNSIKLPLSDESKWSGKRVVRVVEISVRLASLFGRKSGGMFRFG